MKRQKKLYFIILLCSSFTVGLYAQSSVMQPNTNKIERNTASTTQLNTTASTTNNIQLKVARANDSLYAIRIVNSTASPIPISLQDWHLFLIQEAKNKQGEWKPIEYWEYSTCGNSYLTETLKPNGFLETKSIAYSGNYETEIRFKWLHNHQVYYTNPIKGAVHTSQFLIPEDLLNQRLFARIYRLGGTELLNKVLFLEPDGMKEFEAKQKAFVANIAERNQQKKE